MTNEEFKKKLPELKSSDFDGHTDFEFMTLEQRLAWLSSCARFWYAVHERKTQGKKQ
ncbi:MAG: hypothetical protein JW904_04610 [Spirochaetales bacterium]|nr:hypothetical protein [Spirochaetales bacterium]